MKFMSRLIDRKIMGVNIGAELPIGEYFEFAPRILRKNGFQRKKVKTAGKTYDLLKKDLVQGCIIPPIILAVTNAYGDRLNRLVERAIEQGDEFDGWEEIEEYIERAKDEGELLILDGLQRSFTIESIMSDGEMSAHQRMAFLRRKMRIEIYVGLSKTGILYRMLTLNTGQTPMSFRHQLEILYYDYVDNDDLPDGISVVKEVDERRARGGERYRYADVVDMFYAYSTGSPMPYDKQALIGELREINFLESYTYKANVDDMRTLLVLYHSMIKNIEFLSGGWVYENEQEADISRPFGTTVPTIFTKSQPMAGFGAECKRLLTLQAIPSIEFLQNTIEEIHFSGDPSVAMEQLIQILDQIAKKAKRIGDSQRLYFQCAIRALLLPTSDSYKDLSTCWLEGQENYEMMY